MGAALMGAGGAGQEVFQGMRAVVVRMVSQHVRRQHRPLSPHKRVADGEWWNVWASAM